jgi:hypothetical protein
MSLEHLAASREKPKGDNRDQKQNQIRADEFKQQKPGSTRMPSNDPMEKKEIDDPLDKRNVEFPSGMGKREGNEKEKQRKE